MSVIGFVNVSKNPIILIKCDYSNRLSTYLKVINEYQKIEIQEGQKDG